MPDTHTATRKRESQTPNKVFSKGDAIYDHELMRAFKRAFKDACNERGLKGQRNWRTREALKASMLREWGVMAPLSYDICIRHILTRARTNATNKGIEFSLVEKDIVLPSHCPLLGIKLAYLPRGGHHKNQAASIDRIDSSKGYVPGNIQVVSWRANRLKNDASLDELIKLGEWAAKQKAQLGSLSV